MKTAISVPDETFQRASERAQQLGISRSEFFATAAKRYLEDLDRESLTARIDQALELVGEDLDTGSATEVGRSRLARADW
jgi:metal-responsive CopG/Arc/MetJ family transcriptional regulator